MSLARPSALEDCAFVPDGLDSVRHHLHNRRTEEEQRKFTLKFWAADIAFLATGLRNTPHAPLPGNQFRFHELFRKARTSTGLARQDFNTGIKALLTDLATGLDRVAGSATVQIHFPGFKHPSREHTTLDTRVEVYIAPEVMAKIPTARTTLLQMVQLFIKGIAVPVGQQWQEEYIREGYVRPSVVPFQRLTRPRDALHPKRLNGTPTYALWGMSDEDLHRLQMDPTLVNLFESPVPEGHQDEALDVLRDELDRLRLDNSTLKQQVEEQDVLIAHMIAREERMEVDSDASSHSSSRSASPPIQADPEEIDGPPSYIIYPHNTSGIIPSATVLPQAGDGTVPSRLELRDSAAWRRRAFGHKTAEYMREHGLDGSWHPLLHRIAYEHAPAQWGTSVCDLLMLGQPEEVGNVRLELAFGLSEAMCSDRNLNLVYDERRIGLF